MSGLLEQIIITREQSGRAAKAMLYHWIKANLVMLMNAVSLVGTTAVTSVLGFAYWWIAARYFSPESVGVASAAVSAMMLLGSFGVLGMGTLLITELPRQPGQEGPLISTALTLVGIVGGCTGLAFALVAPSLSPNFAPLRASAADVVIFASGVSFTSIALVLDQSLVGILRGELQFWRNSLFSIAKLIILFPVGLWLSSATGMAIYSTWAMGIALSFVSLALLVVFKKGGSIKSYRPQWRLLRKLGLPALQHHLLNLTLQAPIFILPILVTALLSARMNAWFYVSWMIASFIFVCTTALTTTLHAISSAQQAALVQRIRVTLLLAFVTSIAADSVLLLGAKQVLGLFGSSYANEAAWTLRILGLAAFPLIIKYHYIAICRIQDRVTGAMMSMAPGGLLELGAAVLGAHIGGLSGLSLGWLIAIGVESIFMLPTVYKAIGIKTLPLLLMGSQHTEPEGPWLVETNRLPAIERMWEDPAAIWLMETNSLPAIERMWTESVALPVTRPRWALTETGGNDNQALALKQNRTTTTLFSNPRPSTGQGEIISQDLKPISTPFSKSREFHLSKSGSRNKPRLKPPHLKRYSISDE